jgi:hypothetical protein
MQSILLNYTGKTMSNEVWDYKGMFWDDVNKRFYRWHELKLLLQERKLKKDGTRTENRDTSTSK